MALATLSIDIEAKLAKFEGDLGKASRSLDKLASNAKSSFASVSAVFAGSFLAGGALQAINQLADAFPRLIEGAAQFQTLAERTGSSAEALAKFDLAAKLSGVSVDTIAGLMVKLTSNLGNISSESKGAGQALANLGIPLEEFRRLRPDEQIRLLSERFNGFEDGVGKTSNALALFGRQGAQILNFFQDYGDGLSQVSSLTAEQIARADQFGKAQARASHELQLLAQTLAIDTIPAITALITGFKDGTIAVLGFQAKTADLRADSAILDFAEGAAVGIAILAESLLGIVKLAQAVGGSFKAVAADIALPFNVAAAVAGSEGSSIKDRVLGVSKALSERNQTVQAANKAYVDLWNYNGTAVSDAIRKSFAQQRLQLDKDYQREAQRMAERANAIKDARPALASVTVPDDKANRAEEQAEAAFRRFLSQIQQRKAIAEGELATGQKLTETERFRLDIMSRLDSAEDKLGPKRTKAIEQALTQATAVLRLNEQQAERAKLLEAETKAVAQQLQQQDATNKALADQAQEIGLSAKAIHDLGIARLEHKLAIEQERTATLALFGLQGAELVQREQVLESLQREIDLRRGNAASAKAIAANPLAGATSALQEYLDKVQESGAATKAAVASGLSSIEDDITTSLASATLNVRRSVDLIISEFLRLQVVRPLLTSLFSSIGGGNAIGAIAKLFGFANGGAFGAGGQVHAFASGGVFNSPQLFRFANGGAMATGVLGEAGPEAVMPLQRGPGGKLGVRNYGGGQSQQVVQIMQTISIGAGVSRNEVMAAMQATKQQTLAAVADAQRRGMAVARA